MPISCITVPCESRTNLRDWLDRRSSRWGLCLREFLRRHTGIQCIKTSGPFPSSGRSQFTTTHWWFHTVQDMHKAMELLQRNVKEGSICIKTSNSDSESDCRTSVNLVPSGHKVSWWLVATWSADRRYRPARVVENFVKIVIRKKSINS